MGARIEICFGVSLRHGKSVAPLVGARIEICDEFPLINQTLSLPSWERGLKFVQSCYLMYSGEVAPLVGARIEICEN